MKYQGAVWDRPVPFCQPVDFNEASVVKCLERRGQPLLAVEPWLEGNFNKYSTWGRPSPGSIQSRGAPTGQSPASVLLSEDLKRESVSEFRTAPPSTTMALSRTMTATPLRLSAARRLPSAQACYSPCP